MRSYVLSIGVLALVAPQLVLAQCPPTGRARELLTKEPTGYYTKEVIRRTNEGIALAKTRTDGASIAGLFDLNSLIMIESIFYMLVDTDLRSVEYSRDLTHISSCLHADLAIIEAQIENVRCEINTAYDGGNSSRIRELKVIANFLNQRYRHLVKGALNPQHVDKSWSAYHSFDPPFQGWCCVHDTQTCSIRDAESCTRVTPGGDGGYSFYPTQDECVSDNLCVFSEQGETTPPYEDICPFDSNYLAFNDSGYGCSADLLEQFTGGSFTIPGIGKSAVEAEKEGQKILEETRDSFVEDIGHIKETTDNMDQLVDGTMLTDEQRKQLQRFGTTSTGDIERRHVYGCNADMLPEERENLDGVEGDVTPGIHPSEEWAGIPLRGPFSFERDHLGVWNTLLKLYLEWENERQFTDYLKHPDEFPEEDDRKKATTRDNRAFGLLYSLRNPARSWRIGTQKQQAIQDAALLPKVQDITLLVRDAMKPLRPAMKNSIDLVDSSEGPLRKFGINYAYFLRRTCIFRPCNEKLDTIMKVLFTDECFPYASGEFDGGLESNPEYEECMDETGDQAYCDAQFDRYLGDPTWQKCQDAVNEL